MLNRRQFIRSSAMISLSPMVPAFLSQSLAGESPEDDQRILVVVQLDGGNDGVNTVIPFADENYSRLRPKLRIPRDKVLRLSDTIGLHPAMKSAAEMFDAGRLSILQGVGYPNPDRSHFRSMAIWHQARLDAEETSGYGWLGTALDQAKRSKDASMDAMFVGDQNVPRALWGRRSSVVSMNRESDLLLSPDWKENARTLPTGSKPADLQSYVERVLDRSYQTAKKIADQAQSSGKSSIHYPNTALAQQLSLVSLMIKNDMAARVYYVTHPGFDTHSGQSDAHDRLLRTFSGALKAFFDDLKESRLDDRVALLAFSEFGRRVEENESGGTDHGAAGPVFLAGSPVIGGLIGEHPSLSDLDEGDLKMTMDFRAIYASVLNHWMNLRTEELPQEAFPCPKLFRHQTA